MTLLTPGTSSPPTALEKRGEKALDFASSDHGSFHGAVGRAALGAALGGLGAHFLAALVGPPLATSPFLTAGITAGALAMIAGRGRKWLKAAVGGSFGLLGTLLFTVTAGTWAPFGALLLGASCAPVLARGDSKRRMALTALVASGFAYCGLFVAQALIGREILAGVLPSPVANMLLAGLGGMFIGLGSAPRHLARPLDPVEEAFREAAALQDGELHEILARSLSMYRLVQRDIAARSEEDPSVRQLSKRVGELMMKILDIARQCRRIERDLSETPRAELEERIDMLKSKAETASDDAAKRTYALAAQSLEEQRRSFETITRGRERVVARLHGNLALLERIRFSLLHLRSAHAERIGEGMFPLADALEELSREIDATSLAVGEVYGHTTSADMALPEPKVTALVPREDEPPLDEPPLDRPPSHETPVR